MESGLVRRAHPLRLELRLRGRRRQQRRRQQRQHLLDGSSIFAAAPPAPLAAATNNNIRRRHSRHVTLPGAKNRTRPPPHPNFSHLQPLPSFLALPAGRGQQRHRDSCLKGQYPQRVGLGRGRKARDPSPVSSIGRSVAGLRVWFLGARPLGCTIFLPALPPLPFQTLDGAIVARLSFSLTRPPAVGEGTWGWIPRGWEGLGGPS